MNKQEIELAYTKTKSISRKIISGEVSAYDGAMKVWKEIIDSLYDPIPEDLWPFKSNASAIEDCKWDAEEFNSNHDELITKCEEEIIEAAKNIIIHI